MKDKNDPRFEHLIGKRVTVKTPEGHTVGGVLQFIGINSLHGEFQVTINRMPIWPVDPNTIKLVKSRKIFDH